MRDSLRNTSGLWREIWTLCLTWVTTVTDITPVSTTSPQAPPSHWRWEKGQSYHKIVVFHNEKFESHALLTRYGSQILNLFLFFFCFTHINFPVEVVPVIFPEEDLIQVPSRNKGSGSSLSLASDHAEVTRCKVDTDLHVSPIIFRINYKFSILRI